MVFLKGLKKMKAEDRVGETKGYLKILNCKRDDGRTYFYCECTLCGRKKWIRADGVVSGNNKSCGCLQRTTQNKRKDLTNRRFGMLVAKYPVGIKNGCTAWHCECDCEKSIVVESRELLNRERESCGCSKKEILRKNMEKALKKNIDANIKEGTNISIISREKPIKSNTSGVTGVTYDKSRNKWLAQIEFKGRHVYLGRFKEKENAIKARKEAEEKYFKPIVNKYKKDPSSH